MKIQCDVCNKMQASLFCTADEAALCSACDHRVHHANKLASKHHRFSLNHANSPNNFPLCDICLERRGFVFCQQDRAIVCKECDFKNHCSNEHTKKHSRFLLSGIKLLSPASISPPPLPFSPAPPIPAFNKVASNEETGTGFTISEYLINTIPGWKFEEFFDSPSSVPFDQFQNHVAEVNADSDPENMVSFLGGIRVPQAPTSSLYYASKMDNRSSSDTNIKLFSSSSSLRDDNNFTVPQMINPPN
ncbi:B-box zinc finger protein 21-like [Vicia villosa]|uniref:B-box zinc finger protein 21-like n=1 Tax=Vicia villosa TaxID=3911 RepID=UPI00273BA6E5|nr:B-box zinc finger protein 21-like [Vicia villosa]